MKKITVKILSVMLAFVIAFSSLIVTPFALDFIGSGSGSSGGGSVGASGGYTLSDTDNCQGYRISYVDSNGIKKPNGRVDVIKSSELSNFNGRVKFSRRLNKKELVTLYNNGSAFNIPTETVAAGNNVTWIDSALNLFTNLNYSFSNMASNMEKWQSRHDNLNEVLSKMSSSYSVRNMLPGDMILIEPIIFCKFNNTNYAVTLTELWMMAGSMFGYRTQAKFGGNDGTFNRIAYRVNGTFPNSLYTTNGKGLWGDAAAIYVPSYANGYSGPAFSTFIAYGYGVCIAYTNTSYVTYDHWLVGLPSGTGTNATKDGVRMYQNSETYSGTVSVTTSNTLASSKLPKGIYTNTSTFVSNSFEGSWKTYYYPKTFTGQSGTKIAQIFYGPITYNITYNLNGGTLEKNNPSTYTVLQGASFTNSPTKEGYTFLGWYLNGTKVTGVNQANLTSSVFVNNTGTSDCSTKTLYNTLNARTTGNITVEAKWSQNQISTKTATFDSNGGTTASPETITRTPGTALGTLPTTTYTGHTFDGWYTSPSGGTEISDTTPMPSTDTTYYAHWTPNTYTIKFDGNGSTSGSTASMSMTYDEAKNLTANGFIRTGYTFNGWNTNSSGTGTNYVDKQSVKNLTSVNGGTVTLYAKWTKNQTQYTATFDANGGTTASPKTITRTPGTILGTLPTTTRTGYTLIGWYTAVSGGTQISSSTTMPARNVTYYAHWRPNTLSICFDCYDFNTSINTSKGYKFDGIYNRICTTTYTNKEVDGTKNVFYQSIEYGKTIGSGGLKDFSEFGLITPTGYTFSGWKSGDNGKIFDATTTTYTATDFTNDILTGDTHVWLTAQFKPIQYTATFDSNGGTTASPKTIKRTVGTALGTLPTTTRTGYTMTGWYTAVSGGAQISSSTTMPARNVTYYAHWTPNKAELQLQPISANSSYTEGTDVVTSFYLINTSNIDCVPGNNISVKFTVTKSNGTVIKTYTKSQVIVPENDYNLIYFKWTVPNGLSSQAIKVSGEIVDGSNAYGKVTGSYSTKPKTTSNTPDTQFEKNMPSGFSIVSPPTTIKQNATWEEWTYSNGKFVKKYYGVTINSNNTYIEPKTGSTHQYKNDMWYMKSGYGIGLTLNNGSSTVSGYTAPPTAAYTAPQTAYALFPEYKYVASAPYYQTLSLSSGQWIFPGIHYTPLWYPNGKYIVSVTQSDMWTPAGMIKRTSNSNEIRINGSAYDDWYVGR